MIDLAAELQAATSNIRQPHIDRLVALGVSGRALATLGSLQLPFGALRVSVGPRGLFWPDPDGLPAIVVPVIEYVGPFRVPEAIDMIAFRTTDPARWWWRTGHGAMLGADLLRDPWPVGPLFVVSTPLAWIAAGGAAVCVLDWDCPDTELFPLRHQPELVCESPRLAARLSRRLSRPQRLPRISSMETNNVAA